MSSGARRVALFWPAGSEYSNRLIEGVVRYHRERGGFVLRDFRYRTPEVGPPGPLFAWEHWQPHGVLCHIGAHPGVAECLVRSGVPVVNTTTDCPHATIPSVHGSGAGRLAARHLLSLGYEHLAFIGDAGRLGSVRLRETFARELTLHGKVPLGHDLTTVPDFAIEALEERAASEPGLAEFLASAPKPLGVFALDDDYARVVCRVCRRLGLDVPDDVAVLGIEDSLRARLNDPPLSTIRPPGEQVGYEAMALLDRLMQGERPPPAAVEVPTTTLVVRESTSRGQQRDEEVEQALRMIDEEACRGLTVAHLAEALRVPRSTLEDRFAEQVGRSPGEQIDRVRLDAARRLLAETELSIARIAGMVGFSRSSGFGGFFRRAAGMSPTQYRREQRA